MSVRQMMTAAEIPNGAGAAAILAAAIGNLAVALLAIAGDKIAFLKSLMTFYRPAGPLSGVTTCAVLVWLAAWLMLEARWRTRDVAMSRVSAVAFVLLLLSLLLTFPPIAGPL